MYLVFQSSGLGKLMNVLHQNAASLVNTKSEHNGPDQVGAVLYQLLTVAHHHLAGVDSHGVHHLHQEPGSQDQEGGAWPGVRGASLCPHITPGTHHHHQRLYITPLITVGGI